MTCLFACGTQRSDDAALGTSASGATGNQPAGSTSGVTPEASTGEPEAESSSGFADESTGDDPGTNFDLGAGPDAGPPPSVPGCPAVDFLFVIDNSISMLHYQENLQAAFPAFIDDIQSSLESVESYHVGVVTTDHYIYNQTQCQRLGALVTQSHAGVCGPYAEGHNFMTEADDLAASFTCASTVGNNGDMYEKPMAALEGALGQTWSAQDDQTPTTQFCNEGFVRDDALLVAVIVGDEPEGHSDASPGVPSTWYQSVIDAKGGQAENAVVLTITNGDACTPPLNDGGISAFADLFGDNGSKACIRDDFSASLGDSIDVITQACADFVPPG
ncbi:MAG: hypothetical protein AAGA54_16075 [Myxococcota bacterium]